jgi:hypothetical protein
MTNARYIPAQWEATPYGSHWSFAYELNGEKREDYDFRVEFTIGVSAHEQAAVIRVLEAALDMRAACRLVVDRWERGDLAEAARACNAAIANAEGTVITPAPGEAAVKPHSVLLLYPDWLNDNGTETYYAFVEAADAIEAVAVAQQQAAAAQSVEVDDPADFAPLLVTEGHHASQPLFNK